MVQAVTVGVPSWNDLAGGTTTISNLLGPAYVSVCDFPGTDASQKIANAIASLPGTGGTIDARCLTGAQTISQDVFSNVTKPVDFMGGQAIYTVAANTTIPANVHLMLGEGSIFSVNPGIILTVNGPMDGSSLSTHFQGLGTTTFRSNTHIREVYPQWWGALANGVIGVVSMTAGSPTLTTVAGFFTSDVVGRQIVVEGAGPASTTLITSIASFTNATTVTLALSASTSVNNVMGIWATDDTAAINAALAAALPVFLPKGTYGTTSTIGLYQGTQLRGAGIASTGLARIALGAGGPAVGMVVNEIAQKVLTTDFAVYCTQVGANNDGIALGVQGNNYAFANGSWMHNVRVISASGVGININSNIGDIGQIWIQNGPGIGTPTTLAIPNAVGFQSANTAIYADLISVEGYFSPTLGSIILGAGGSYIKGIQTEINGGSATTPMMTCIASGQTVESVFIHAPGTTFGDIVHINSGVQIVSIRNMEMDSPVATFTNWVNDLTLNITVPFNGNSSVSLYRSNQANVAFYDNNVVHYVGLRSAFPGGVNGNLSLYADTTALVSTRITNPAGAIASTYVAHLSTNDAVAHTLWSFPLTNNAFFSVKVQVVARSTVTGLGDSAILAAMFFSSGGAGQQGTTTVIVAPTTYTVAFAVSGTNLLLNVTGAAGVGVGWGMEATVVFVSA